MSALVALLLTIGIELPIAWALSRKQVPRDWMPAVVCVNLLTQPTAFLLVHPVGFWPLELAVFAVEAALYSWILDISWHRAISVSLLANGATAAIGCALF
ncbi:MAG: hypothetical protein R3F17_13305 [Planctomycetota bacterium]